MDYPSIPFILDSNDTRNDPVLLSVARSGAPKVRRLYDRARRRFNIVHRGLTDAQKAIVDQFLADNRGTAFTIWWPCRVGGVAYSVLEETGSNQWDRPEGLWATSIAVVEA